MKMTEENLRRMEDSLQEDILIEETEKIERGGRKEVEAETETERGKIETETGTTKKRKETSPRMKARDMVLR